MKRENLFRAKRINNQKWIVGHYVHYVDCDGIEKNLIYSYNGNANDIESETVGEYIGIPDKNKNEIFEGDIIKTKYYGKDSGNGVNFNDYDFFRVIHHEASFCIENATRRFVITAESAKRFEIIGNIHDNPELIKKNNL